MLGPVPIEPPPNLPVPKKTPLPPSTTSLPLTTTTKAPLSSTLSVLEHTGIPRSVLTWKPRLPSRNWSIFLSIVIGTGSLYYYDRSECKRLKKEYVDKVKHLAEEKMGGTLEYPRLVKVYAAKWPEDEDYDRGLLYFRQYVKPVLVAAAIDYELITSPQHGALTRHVLSVINTRRRRDLNLDPSNTNPQAPDLPYALNKQQEAEREVRGGIVLVGRHSLKEYLEGLRRGWMDDQLDGEEGLGEREPYQGVRKFDMEGKLKLELEREETEGKGPFAKAKGKVDESGPEFLEEAKMQNVESGEGQDVVSSGAVSTASTITSSVSPPPSTPSNIASLGSRSFFARPPPSFPSLPSTSNTPPIDPDTLIPPHLHLAPNPLPPTPPMLLVPWTNHLGFQQLPYMFIGLFNERKLVREGGEAGLRLVLGGVREFVGPQEERSGMGRLDSRDDGILRGSEGSAASTSSTSSSSSSTTPTDLDFDLPSERYYKNDFEKLPSRIESARSKYYSASSLPARIETARALASNEREPTKEEISKPPSTEEELKKERLEKELRWRRDLQGWRTVRKGSGVVWDERWRNWLKVYGDPVGRGLEEGGDKTSVW